MASRERAAVAAVAHCPIERTVASQGLKNRRWTSQVSYHLRWGYLSCLATSLDLMGHCALGSQDHRLRVARVDRRDGHQILLLGCCWNLMVAMLNWKILRDQVMGQAPQEEIHGRL